MAFSRKTTAFCPECGHNIKLVSPVFEGQIIMCSGCQTGLEIISLQPLNLDVALEEPVRGREREKPKRTKFRDSWDEF